MIRSSSKKASSDPSLQTEQVIANGIQFIERGVNELWKKNDKLHLKHSVINFYSGVELLLKARLMMEHWALVVSDTKAADAEKFISGDFRSVGLDEAISRLRKIARLEVSASAVRAFTDLQQHRNQMVHFYHRTDLRTKEGRQLRSQIINEQCVGWFELRRLLDDAWAESFAPYQEKIQTINGLMKGHEEYLRNVFTRIQDELSKEEKRGANIGSCFSCGFPAHVVKPLGPSESVCRVCTAGCAFLRHKCQSCDHLFLVDEGSDHADCPECGWHGELSEVMDDYTAEGNMLPKDAMIEGGYGNCGECSGYHTVGSVGERSFCFQCHQFQEPMEVCGWCGEKTTDDTEMSYYSGCVMCDGKAGWERD